MYVWPFVTSFSWIQSVWFSLVVRNSVWFGCLLRAHSLECEVECMRCQGRIAQEQLDANTNCTAVTRVVSADPMASPIRPRSLKWRHRSRDTSPTALASESSFAIFGTLMDFANDFANCVFFVVLYILWASDFRHRSPDYTRLRHGSITDGCSHLSLSMLARIKPEHHIMCKNASRHLAIAGWLSDSTSRHLQYNNVTITRRHRCMIRRNYIQYGYCMILPCHISSYRITSYQHHNGLLYGIIISHRIVSRHVMRQSCVMPSYVIWCHMWYVMINHGCNMSELGHIWPYYIQLWCWCYPTQTWSGGWK